MGYDLNKHKIILQPEHVKLRRIFFKRKNIARFFYPLAVLFGVFVTCSLIAPAFAAPITKASALTLEEMREGYTANYTSPRLHRGRQSSPQVTQADSCRRYLSAHFPPNAKDSQTSESPVRFSSDPHIADQKAMPVTLSFMLGFRHALVPNTTGETTRPQADHQKVATSSHVIEGGIPRTLAIAAYRACKNEATLKAQRRSRHAFKY